MRPRSVVVRAPPLEHLERSKEQGEGLCVDAGSRVELMKINKKNCP